MTEEETFDLRRSLAAWRLFSEAEPLQQKCCCGREASSKQHRGNYPSAAAESQQQRPKRVAADWHNSSSTAAGTRAHASNTTSRRAPAAAQPQQLEEGGQQQFQWGVYYRGSSHLRDKSGEDGSFSNNSSVVASYVYLYRERRSSLIELARASCGRRQRQSDSKPSRA